MLILAGVSINAIVGDNGVLTKTTYASFLSEMSAVEEAVQMWKAGEIIEAQGDEVKAIPANGLCRANDLISAERLVGEVGYYRVWSLTSTMPTTDILSSADNFNSSFESELVFYPAGVQDLYYLNNDALEIKGNKTYLIDATTGMIFSMTGISLKGVRCYSSSMAKAVMNGSIEQPLFAEAEVSGTGDNIAYAGQKYLVDKDGNYIDENGNIVDEENRVENPNGFQIIASPESDNIFKLYNNGDLYGKGIKGHQLNTSVTEMDKLNSNVWGDFVIPNEIDNVKNIFVGTKGAIYYVDNSGNCWVFGENKDNKFGLSNEQQFNYTGRESQKVDLNGEKVSKIWGGDYDTFILTESNKLLAAGFNEAGELGIGNLQNPQFFTEVNFDNPSSIENVYFVNNENHNQIMVLIKTTDNKFYYSGIPEWNQLGIGRVQQTEFTRVWDGELGDDIDHEIKDVILNSSSVVLKKDGTLWTVGYADYFGEHTSSVEGTVLKKYSDENVNSIDHIYCASNSIIFTRINESNKKELWAIPGSSKFFEWTDINHAGGKWVRYPIKIDLPINLESEGVKEVYPVTEGFYVLSNAGKLYGMGRNMMLGMNYDEGYTKELIYLNKTDVSSLYSDSIGVNNNKNSILILNSNGKQMVTSDSNIMFGDNILQKNWTLVASNVAYKSGEGDFYVDRSGSLWVCGDSRVSGLGSRSETYEYIPNYIKCTDSNIDGRVKKAWKCDRTYVTYVLLDNDELWATGLYSTDGSPNYPGWEGTDNKTSFVKIMENVKFFDNSNKAYILIKNDGTCFSWGSSCYSIVTNYSDDLKTFNLPSEIGNVNNIKELYTFHPDEVKSGIVTNDGKFFLCGAHDGRDYDGGASRSGGFHEYTYNIVLKDNEKIIKVVKIDYDNALILTNQGRLFGWGNANLLGINKTNSNLMETQLLSGISNVKDIVAGNGWYVAVTNDGKVYGTGANRYGILGRWVGVGRGDSNSRYKTAFNWVECPELEI